MDMGYFSIVITFILLVYVLETYLDMRQYSKLKERQKPQALTYVSQEDFEAARLYAIDKMVFHIVSSLYQQIELLAMLYYNFLPYLWVSAGNLGVRMSFSSQLAQSLIFLLFYTIIGTITSLPFELYSTFVVEAKHGFNKQTPQLFFTDKLKTFVLTCVIGAPLVSLILVVIEWGGQYFYLYVCGVMIGVQLLLVTLYPTLIQPLFNKVTPLRMGELRTAIETLAAQVEFPLTKLFVIDGSKRSGHSNAYFWGFWKNKRIVLYDTLIGKEAALTEEQYKEKQSGIATSTDNTDKTDKANGQTSDKEEDEKDFCTQSEVVAILGHELGHWKKNHTLKIMAINQVQITIVFWGFGRVMHDAALYEAFGFKTQATLIGLLLFGFLFSPADHVLNFLMHILSRKFEFEADYFAVKLGYAVDLASGLIKLQKSNKSNMNPDPLYCAYHYSHPPLVERLDAIHQATKTSKIN
eukprot:gb/GEZN01006777.1/.p1 GENE.gb/GEZN01006777.1/~~gb/GEZN01006777.1/.p1  ORF type:complete len:474 (-),score=45.71 gb/GEZN01006777.1/:198-1595(-)